MLGCKTNSGGYMVFKASYPTPIVKGTEERELDAERNDLADYRNGKVISEKRVRANGKPGRDFTIRGTPIEETGVLTIRVREYLDGRSIYIVAAVSAPNRELPEDTGRFLGSLAIGEAKTRASGTPEPEPKGTELTGWGLAIDPDNDCKFTPGERKIAFEVPGKLHDLFFDGGPTNAPRVLREVQGDFVMSVKVAGEFKPGSKSTNPKSLPYLGAGILLWSDSDNNIRFERTSFLRSGKVVTGVAFQEREGGYSGAVHNELYKAGDCYLRLERRGSRILGAISSDGTNWKQLKPIDTVWPAKLKAGLTAISTSNEPFWVKFEEFDLKTK
jgi:regulation of enolase protein 1 (concanavalin A-like superfamily)